MDFCHAGFSRKTAASYLRATDGRPCDAVGCGNVGVQGWRFLCGNRPHNHNAFCKTVVAIPFYNAAMQVIYKSNVRFADWVKRHACGLPTAAAVADWVKRHTCGSQARQCYFGYTIM